MIYGNKFKNKCPIDEETKNKIKNAADQSAKKINSKYLSRVKSMMKNPNHKDDDSYTKDEIDEVNFNDISIHFSWKDSFDIYFDSIKQNVYYDINEELEIWNDIAEILKNDINKAISQPEFKIKKYQIVEDSAAIVMIFKP